MSRHPVAVLGATGTVGQKFIRLLANHPWFQVTVVAASPQSVGKRYADAAHWREPVPIPDAVADLVVLPSDRPVEVAVAFSALDTAAAGPIEPAWAQAGAAVVTNASPYRMDPTVPLLVPEVNPGHAATAGRPAQGRELAGRDRGQSQLHHRRPGGGAGSPAPGLRGESGLRVDHAGHLGRRLARRGVARHPRQRDPLHQERGREGRAGSPRRSSATWRATRFARPRSSPASTCNRVAVHRRSYRNGLGRARNGRRRWMKPARRSGRGAPTPRWPRCPARRPARWSWTIGPTGRSRSWTGTGAPG